MKIIIRLTVGFAIAVLLVGLIGWFLPVDHVATASRTYAAPPETLYRLIADIDGYSRWWSDDPGIKTVVVEASPPHRFVTRIADPDQPFGGTWTFEITRDGSGTRVTITERGEVYNPIFRFLSRFVFGHTGTMDSMLDALQGA